MKKILYTILMCFAVCEVNGQVNLVPNGSFEEYSQCPGEVGELELVNHWTSFRGSSDYFNTCANSFASVPCNRFGCQDPATGNGYAGVYTFYPNTPIYREIIGTQLREVLTIGQAYYVSFKASPGYGAYFDTKWFSNKLGLKFSMNEYDINNPAPIDNFAHIYSDDIISDTLIWTTVSGYFVADTSYAYIMLGNFFDNMNTDTLTNDIVNYASYYYIDDVCVTTNYEGCNFTNNIEETTISNVTVYPIPAINTLYISYSAVSNPDISIFDIMGRNILADIMYSNDLVSIDVSKLVPGTYLLNIKDNLITISKKFFINN